MGNLLTLKSTFEWEDNLLNRGKYIEDLNDAILESKEHDTLYKTNDFNSIDLSWGNLMEFVFNYGFDDDIRAEMFPWMSQSQHTTLVYIFSSFKNTTELNSNNLASLKEEFPGENCGYIGFNQNSVTIEYVSCKTTLELFHFKYVSSFNRKKRLEEKKYFAKFFKPSLKIEANQIQRLIDRKQVNPLFKRIDKPSKDPKGQTLHEEQIQMHFNDKNKSALYIDGNWKHRNFEMPDDVCEKLIEWGFMLPENII